MKRRILAGILSLAMVFTMLPASPVRAEGANLGTNLALSATASADHNNTGPGAINDGTLATGDPATSWNCWDAPESGYPMPITLTWSEPQKIASMRVMWWADGGGVIWPSNAKVEYLDGEEWKEIADAGTDHGGYNGENGVWNNVNFDKEITTTALRMRVGRNATGSSGVGISEWEVYGTKIKEELIQANIVGSSKITKGETEKFTAKTVPEEFSSTASYEWSVSPNSVAVIEGSANTNEVSVKGLAEGEAALSLKATQDGVTKETEFNIRVREDKIKSIDIYKTSTAAGTAPILPDSVVANGLEFDDPTPSLKSETKPEFDFAEEFNSKLVPVKWESVSPESYAKGKEGTSFTVKGTVEYKGKNYDATAMVSVKDAVAAPESNSSVTFENVQLNDIFWAPKQEINAKSSLKKAISEIGKASGGEPNFDNAIKKLNGETDYDAFSGYVFQDSDIYKSIEAISYTLSATQNDTDPEMAETRKFLEETLERWIQKIEKVQYADGYIGTFFTLRSQSSSGGGAPGTHRWLNFSNHEMYNAGHFLESVVAYTRYREGMGKPDYRLYIAGKRFADEIVSLFGPFGTRHEVPGHEEIELGMVKFGKLVEEYEGQGTAQDYYDTVRLLINRRGEDSELRESGYWAGTYSQDQTPFKEETNAVGHAVRANYFYTGITDIATLLPDGNGDKSAYLDSLDTIWDSVTNRKTYITGAIGTTTPGSDSEGYGKDYDLPPDQSYAETCAAIAAANWNQRMNLVHEDAKYADMVERNLYNSVLVGTNLDGNRFYYSTRLRVNGGNARSEWFACACCPPNLMRTIAALSGYMYTVHNDTLFVNMYVGSDGSANVGGTQVGLKQETNYPWEGAVKLTVTPKEAKKFTMKIRVPGWVNEQENKTVTVKVNNTPVTAAAEKGYIAIDRTWNANDVVTIDMPMEIRKTESHPLVTATKGQIALQRGPVVYCMEKAGNAQLNADIADFDPLNFVIPRDAELKAEYNKDLLNGVVEITGDVKYASGTGVIDAKLQAVPYYAWNNRGDDAEFTPGLETPKNNSTKMLIWTNAADAEPDSDPTVSPDDGKPSIPTVNVPQLRSYATPSVNHVGWGAGADRFADDSMSTFWNGHNDPDLETKDQWMMYDFGENKVKLTGSDISFYDDGGGVMVPTAITVEYEKEDGTWAEVTKKGEWTFEATNEVTWQIKPAFEEVETSKIRVTMTHGQRGGSKVAVAVYDWKLEGDFAATAEEKKGLSDAIANVESILAGLKEEDYVPAQWKALQDAIAAAKTVAEKEGAGLITEVAASQKAIADAYAALDRKADTAIVDALQKLVDDYKAKKEDYSETSWKVFEPVLTAAETVIKDSVGKQEFKDAQKAINEAAANLDPRADAQLVNDLKALVDTYSGKEAEYTAASWAKFKDAFAAADTVVKSGAPGQTEVAEAKSALETVVSKLDKKAEAKAVADLKEAVASYKEADYTAESWKRFKHTLEEVTGIANSEDPGEKMISAAMTSLNTAKLKLVKNADSASSTKLNTAIEDAGKNYKESDYAPDVWAEFSQALETAKNTLGSGETSQEMIDAVQKMLDDAIAKLKAQPDKKALSIAISDAEKYNESEYTTASWEVMASALKNAKDVMNSTTASQEMVNTAKKALDDAAAQLKKLPVAVETDKTKLAATIETAKRYKSAGYTTASWKEFTTAFTTAQSVLNNKDASQTQIDAADTNLKKAISGLQKIKVIKKKATVGLTEKYSVKTKNCTYVTSNKKIATVSSKGVVSTKKTGTVTIQAVNKNGKEITEFKITVKKKPTKISKVTPAKKTLKKGKTCKLKVTLPKGTASNQLKFTSSNKKVATVSSAGVVKAKKKGKAVITVKTFNNKSKKVKITVK